MTTTREASAMKEIDMTVTAPSAIEKIKLALKPFAEKAKIVSHSRYDVLAGVHQKFTFTVAEMRALAEAYASLSEQSAGEGWKLMPPKATDEMLKASRGAIRALIQSVPKEDRKARFKAQGLYSCLVDEPEKSQIRYEAMFAAAPASPFPVDRRAVLEEAAKICDESLAEAEALREVADDFNTRLSRTSWANTSRMLATQIRALAASPSLSQERVTVTEAGMDGVVMALKNVLKWETEGAKLRGLTDCTCMARSRGSEILYETGKCPHQLARAALAALEAMTVSPDNRRV